MQPKGRETDMENPTTERETLEGLLKKVQGGLAPPPTASGGTSGGASPVRPFDEVDTLEDSADLDPRRPRAELLSGIHLKVRAELGRARLLLKDALQLLPGSVIDLEKLGDDPVDLYVNDLLVARGEVLVINDCFCIRITEVFAPGGAEGEG